MMKLKQSELAHVSFPDCDVTQFHTTETSLDCIIDGIYIENQGLIETTVILSISDWQKAVVERFDSSTNQLIILLIQDAGELVDICECYFTINEASIAGFEKHSGLWQTIKFQSANISIELL